MDTLLTLGRVRPRGRAMRDTLALIETLGCYWLAVFPVARRELCSWRARARAIPNSTLREIACRTLGAEGLNAEGAALFAMLAPAGRRSAVTRLLVAFQVMYDYLDALTEQPAPEQMRSSRQLHRALLAALGGPTPSNGYFAHYALADTDDGGYLGELVESCRAIFCELPGAEEAMPYGIRAAARSAEGQSHSHTAAFTPGPELIRWARRETPAGRDLRWWETAAAAESSLLIHALLASAAGHDFSATYAMSIVAAYWPWITGLNALLDDLIDMAEDATEGTHSYVGRYASPAEAAQRLAAMAAEASAAIAELPLRRRHAVIFAAMTSYYLSAPQAVDATISLVARAVAEQVEMDLRPLLVMLRLRRRFSRS